MLKFTKEFFSFSEHRIEHLGIGYLRTAIISSNKFTFLMIGTLDWPYINLPKLHFAYSELSGRDPLYLWRIMSLALWWKKCIQGEALL